MNNDIRCCQEKVPTSNMIAPDREKMWGDLKGGKKSVSELRGAPEALTITLSNPNLALKRQRSWEDIKSQSAKNTNQWLDPNYKPPKKGAPAAAPQEPKKKNFFGF
jgi:hypothetical protein